MNHKILFETPEAVSRLGPRTFVKLGLYQTIKKSKIIYINEILFKKIFNITNKSISWADMSEFLTQVFNCTLDKEKSNGIQQGWAYVDRQADPSDISLSGNEGSGRAYYTGPCFNIKGEKTPLATSTSENHSDGNLSLSDAIWNTLVANSLEDEFDTGLSPVLAILDLNDDDHNARIIRIDNNGFLDRITHIFYNHKKLSKYEFITTAQAFGKYEAEKFIHRILHGSWSCGNISLEGHLIDYDSVCAVKGRQPQYVSTSYHIENFFGYEYYGQLLILKSLLDDPTINTQNVALDVLKIELLNSFNKQAATKLAYLMGFEHYQDIYEHHQAEFMLLAKLFVHLSRYSRYTAEKSFFTNYPLHLVGHLLDFSAFFRIYPLIKQYNKFSLESGFSLMAESSLLMDENDVANHSYYHEPHFKEEVLAYIKDYLITDNSQLPAIKKGALKFLKAYDELYDKILLENQCNMHTMAARAYIINEDRLYMFPVFDASRLLINDRLNILITANKRNPNAYVSDVRLFSEGHSCILLDGTGFFKVVFHILKSKNNHLKHENAFQIKINNDYFLAVLNDSAQGYYEIISEKIPTLELIENNNRDTVFLINKYLLYSNGQQVIFSDLYINDIQKKYYLTNLFNIKH